MSCHSDVAASMEPSVAAAALFPPTHRHREGLFQVFPQHRFFHGTTVIAEGDPRVQVVPVEIGVGPFFRMKALL